MNALGSGVKKFLWAVWRIVRWPIGILAALYVGLVIYELFHLPRETAATVAAIHAQRLTMADVDGKNLPPQPDPKLVDATVEGIDANKNGIRDDVELAIFKKYPKDTKVRAAELQYAMELQNEFTKVSSKETLVAVVQEEGRGSSCISSTAPQVNLSDTEEEIHQAFLIADQRKKEVEGLVYSGAERSSKQAEIYQKYMASYSELRGQECDLKF